MKTPVIDVHLHASSISGWGRQWPFVESFAATSGFYETVDANGVMKPELVEALLRRCGIDYALLLPELSPLTTYYVENEWVFEFCKHSTRFLPCANINPHLEHDLGGLVRRYIAEHGLRAIKLAPTYQHFYPNDSRLYPLYAVAEECGLPVHIHTGTSIFRQAKIKYGYPLLLDDIAVDFPRLKLVAVHSGRRFWYDEAFFLGEQHENVYLEIAGLPPKKLPEYFPKFKTLTHKFIFGSDWPAMPSLEGNIAQVRALPIPPEDQDAILGGTAARLLGIGTETFTDQDERPRRQSHGESAVGGRSAGTTSS
ncbi:MAG: amidohydrolase [Candidatus Tectomicrobia bacterium]|nr:amidohydrolase [Candidatus Tectomicrobia bacterium]